MEGPPGLLSGEDDTLRKKANPARPALIPPQEMLAPQGQASQRACTFRPVLSLPGLGLGLGVCLLGETVRRWTWI